MSSTKEAIQRDGIALLKAGQHPYSATEIEELIALCHKLPHADGIGEGNRLSVARVLVDSIDVARGELGYASAAKVEAPEIAQPILDIVASQKALDFWADCFGLAEVQARRAQTNFLYEGDEVGLHNDHEANTEYRISIVIGLTDDYTGGAFVAHVTPEDKRHFRLNRGEILVAKPELQHAVETVESGKRVSLILFLS
nr:2OG-Fe(II) oxygenase [Streptomyces sp. NBC_00857]